MEPLSESVTEIVSARGVICLHSALITSLTIFLSSVSGIAQSETTPTVLFSGRCVSIDHKCTDPRDAKCSAMGGTVVLYGAGRKSGRPVDPFYYECVKYVTTAPTSNSQTPPPSTGNARADALGGLLQALIPLLGSTTPTNEDAAGIQLEKEAREAEQQRLQTEIQPKCDGAGTWTNCVADGTYPDGTKYVGPFKNDKPSGRGVAVFPNGNKYVGEFQNGAFNGLGTLTYSDGREYIGNFKDGQFNGEGTLYGPNRSSLQRGPWEDGKLVSNQSSSSSPPSQGTLPKCDGAGTWTNCVADGTYPDGTKYVGPFKNDKPSGRGVAVFPNGNKYVGEFQNGAFNGLGTLTYSDGREYIGNFKDGQFNGEGTLYGPNRSSLQRGPWEDGKLVSNQSSATVQPNWNFSNKVGRQPSAAIAEPPPMVPNSQGLPCVAVDPGPTEWGGALYTAVVKNSCPYDAIVVMVCFGTWDCSEWPVKIGKSSVFKSMSGPFRSYSTCLKKDFDSGSCKLQK